MAIFFTQVGHTNEGCLSLAIFLALIRSPPVSNEVSPYNDFQVCAAPITLFNLKGVDKRHVLVTLNYTLCLLLLGLTVCGLVSHFGKDAADPYQLYVFPINDCKNTSRRLKQSVINQVDT